MKGSDIPGVSQTHVWSVLLIWPINKAFQFMCSSPYDLIKGAIILDKQWLPGLMLAIF